MSVNKKCSNCFALKPLSEFYVRRQKLSHGRIKLTHQARCKECNAEVVKAYYALARNRALQKKWDKLYGRTA